MSKRFKTTCDDNLVYTDIERKVYKILAYRWFFIPLSIFLLFFISTSDASQNCDALFHFSMANLYEKRGMFDEAIEEYKKALRYAPHSSRTNLRLGKLYHLRGDYTASIKSLKNAIESDSSNYEAYTLLGHCFLKINEIDFAISAYEKALALDIENTELHYILANLYETRGNLGNAALELEKVAQMVPLSTEIQIRLGSVYRKLKRFDESISSYKKALLIDPSSYDARLGLATTYEFMEEYDKAISEYRMIENENPAIKRSIIDILLALKRYEDANTECSQLIQSLPFDKQLRFKKALISYEQKKYSESLDELLICRSLDPSNKYVHYYLSKACFKKEMFDEARGSIDEALRLDPEFGDALIFSAFLYMEEGMGEKTVKYLKEAIKLGFDHANAYYLLGYSYAKLEEFGRAISAYKLSLDKNPSDPEVWFSLGVAYDKSGRWEDAIVSFKKVISLDSTNSSAYNYMGYLMADKGINLDESLNLIEKALKLEPDNGYYIDSLGWVYFRLGRLDDALRELKRALTISKDPVIYEHLGDVYYELGMKEEAMAQWEKSLQLGPQNETLRRRLIRLK